MVFRGSPVRRTSSRSTGPEVRWRKLQKGVIPGEHRPGVRYGESGRKSRHDVRAPRERTLGGSKASKRAIRPCAGESGDVCGRRVDARGNSREDTPTFGEGGKLRPVSVVAIVGLVPPPWLRVERATETLATSMRLRAGVTIELEPARKQRPPTRRYGSSRGEGSAGRNPRDVCGMKQGRGASG